LVDGRDGNVRFVPKADIAVIRSVKLIVQPGATMLSVNGRQEPVFAVVDFSSATTPYRRNGCANSRRVEWQFIFVNRNASDQSAHSNVQGIMKHGQAFHPSILEHK
jgi:hypothetical protein